jgi:hypothetical protein
MACEVFVAYQPQAATMVVINQAVAIVAEYSDQV